MLLRSLPGATACYCVRVQFESFLHYIVMFPLIHIHFIPMPSGLCVINPFYTRRKNQHQVYCNISCIRTSILYPYFYVQTFGFFVVVVVELGTMMGFGILANEWYPLKDWPIFFSDVAHVRLLPYLYVDVCDWIRLGRGGFWTLGTMFSIIWMLLCGVPRNGPIVDSSQCVLFYVHHSSYFGL